MAILIDGARWPHRGRLWAHLVSNHSLEELHLFAAGIGVPRRAFQGDHYDVPAEIRERALAAGAVPVASRQIVLGLRSVGLRRRRRQGRTG